MILLSWGGTNLEDNESLIPQQNLGNEIQQSADEICGLGVEHKRPPSPEHALEYRDWAGYAYRF
jgi:hypothetical protein